MKRRTGGRNFTAPGLCISWSLGMLLGAAAFRNPVLGSLLGMTAGASAGGLLSRKSKKK